ncbi:MAG: Cytochrome c oxidase subunit 6A, mitochondrial [Bogoriella megaspora]|nr:MAG: Cytochrome c oxidase subunit 6A, mitochondrial [Bogoriella megaspora]
MLAQRMMLRTLRSAPRRTIARRPYATHGAGNSTLTGAQDNAFNQERKAVKDHAAATSAGANAYRLWVAHWEHVEHEEHENPRSERPEYQYQNIRTKNFFWGDGDKARPLYDKRLVAPIC